MSFLSCCSNRNNLEWNDFSRIKDTFDNVFLEGNEEDILNTYCDYFQYPNVKAYFERMFDIKGLVSRYTDGLTVCDTISEEYLLSMKVFIKVLKVDINKEYKEFFQKNLLRQSISRNVISCTKLLIECGCDLNLQSGTGESALHIAVYLNNFECVKLLIGSGCTINLVSKTRGTPLCLAASSGDIQILKALIDAGGDLNLGSGKYSSPLGMAVCRMNFDCAKILLESGCNVNGAEGSNCPLHSAAILGDPKCMQFLINHGCDIEIKDQEGKNALELAAEYNMTEFVKFLERKGCTLTLRTEKKNMTPLYVAAHFQDPFYIKKLLKAGCDKKAVSKSGMTALRVTAFFGYLENLSILIESGCILDMKSKIGRTALYDTILLDHPECTKLLIKAGCNVNVVDQKGLSPLHVAAKCGNYRCLTILFEAGSYINLKSYRGGYTPLYFAAQKGRTKAVEILLKTGGCDKNIRSSYGLTPLMVAKKNKRTKVVELLEDKDVYLSKEKVHTLSYCEKADLHFVE